MTPRRGSFTDQLTQSTSRRVSLWGSGGFHFDRACGARTAVAPRRPTVARRVVLRVPYPAFSDRARRGDAPPGREIEAVVGSVLREGP